MPEKAKNQLMVYLFILEIKKTISVNFLAGMKRLPLPPPSFLICLKGFQYLFQEHSPKWKLNMQKWNNRHYETHNYIFPFIYDHYKLIKCVYTQTQNLCLSCTYRQPIFIYAFNFVLFLHD